MTVYILFSESINKFYVGFTTEAIEIRIQRHNNYYYENKFTSKGAPWVLFLEIKCESKLQALAIEKHIKAMKSKKYIQNLKVYPEIIDKLKDRYK